MKTLVLIILALFWIVFGFGMANVKTRRITNKFVRIFLCILFIVNLPIIIIDDLGTLYGEYFDKRLHNE